MRELHFSLALLSVSGFLLRFGWTFTAPDMLQLKWVRIAPHVVDTLLLIAGVYLIFNLPDGSSTTWLWAKLTALLGYIGFGVLALRGAGRVRLLGGGGALLCVAYIFVAAYTRQVLPF
ncbi:MAG: SirB2 family protein [Pseudomonadota bacterium]